MVEHEEPWVVGFSEGGRGFVGLGRCRALGGMGATTVEGMFCLCGTARLVVLVSLQNLDL